MVFYDFKVGDKTYSCRLTTKRCVELEKALGKNPLSIFLGVNEENLPKLQDIITILQFSVNTDDDINDIVDGYLDDGNSFTDLINLVVNIMKVSGLIAEVKPNQKN